MENINDMQKKKVADDELDQVTGGRKLFGLFNAAFFEPKNQDDPKNVADDSDFGVSTLEMRANPMKKEKKDSQNVFKI